MNAPFNTRTFKNGNSVAVRLPRDLGVEAGVDVELRREGGSVTITPKQDREGVRAEMARLVAELDEIGYPADGVQARDPFEFPDRVGL